MLRPTNLSAILTYFSIAVNGLRTALDDRVGSGRASLDPALEVLQGLWYNVSQ